MLACGSSSSPNLAPQPRRRSIAAAAAATAHIFPPISANLDKLADGSDAIPILACEWDRHN